MKNNFKSLIELIKRVIIDKTSRYLLLSTFLLALLSYLIWSIYLSTPDLFVYIRIAIYPIQYLAIILFINTALAIFSYDKEREISYLLLMANIIVGVMTLVLEIYYLYSRFNVL